MRASDPHTASTTATGAALDRSPATSTLLARYRAVRAFTQNLCAPLVIEDYVVQSMPDASPVKWHLAHTSWFFETFVLKPSAAGYRLFDPAYEVLFNSYYNSVGEQFPRSHRGLLSRPTVDEVRHYRSHVDAAILALLDGRHASLDNATGAVIELGLQHEQQHQELILTDLKHLFSINPLHPVYRPRPGSTRGAPQAPGSPAWAPFAGGLYEVGHGGTGFAFDNETPRHRVFLEPFALAARLVTTGEFAAFIDDGGYERPELWLSDGWDAARREGWEAPLYWTPQGKSWTVFTLAGLRALDPAEPVCHVSYYEADAFARWVGARLPSEAEWEVAASSVPIAGNFVEAGGFHPAALAAGSPPGAMQLFGDVWEWTQSPYTPYPGYRQPQGAFGEYNAKFMSSQMVLRGGSCVSPQSHLRASYRNFFPPGARWQFTGLRLARDAC